VGSSKGAIGFWQFLGSTGQKYGLRINAEIDERRNIFASTLAAINYFKDLYQMLGSWTLSAAAFNMGELGLQTEMVSQKTNDYYQLYLPLETQRYIFRIISAKIILSDPQRFGFEFTDQDLYPPLSFDRIHVECFQDTPIHIVAQAANTHFKAIKDLNPEIRGHFLAAGMHSLLLPKGAADGFYARFKERVQLWVAENQERVYVVKEGDNLTVIAERFNVPLPALLIWNRLDGKKAIHPGDRIVIYPHPAGSDVNPHAVPALRLRSASLEVKGSSIIGCIELKGPKDRSSRLAEPLFKAPGGGAHCFLITRWGSCILRFSGSACCR
jgi:hypothetical protein